MQQTSAYSDNRRMVDDRLRKEWVRQTA